MITMGTQNCWSVLYRTLALKVLVSRILHQQKGNFMVSLATAMVIQNPNARNVHPFLT